MDSFAVLSYLFIGASAVFLAAAFYLSIRSTDEKKGGDSFLNRFIASVKDHKKKDRKEREESYSTLVSENEEYGENNNQRNIPLHPDRSLYGLSEQAVDEQSIWSLPGFASLKALPPSSGFSFRSYRLREYPSESAVRFDLESFTRHFLNYFNYISETSKITLFLYGSEDRLEPVMERRGNIFLSGTAAGLSSLPEEMLESVRDGRFVLDPEGTTGCFPMNSQGGLLGAVLIRTETPLFSTETIRRITSEISRYGEFLYQFRIYDQATRDPQTGLLNGMRFHEDIIRLFYLKQYYKNNQWLVLIQFPSTVSDPFTGKDASLASAVLSAVFREENGNLLYRIASDAFAVTGPEIKKEELKQFFKYLKESMKESGAGRLNRYAISAVTASREYADAQEWFDRSGLCLEESALSGDAVYLENKSSKLLKF